MSTVLVNVTGCLFIGVLYAATPNTLLRAFLGIGVLGGYTTYSTSVLDALQAGQHGQLLPALAYTSGTLAACLLAVVLGTRLAALLPRTPAPRPDPVLQGTSSGER